MASNDEMGEGEGASRLNRRPPVRGLDVVFAGAAGWVGPGSEVRGGICADRGNAVIRQAISCDICGTEKKLTNHWFVAHDQAGELRVSGWNSKNRMRPGSKHLCGQTCLHKLVDEFMARALQMRGPAAEDEQAQVVAPVAKATNASLTSDAAYEEEESSARLVTPVEAPAAARPVLKAPVELVPAGGRGGGPAPLEQMEESPIFMSRQWRAEAWEREREREREMRASKRDSEPALRRRWS